MYNVQERLSELYNRMEVLTEKTVTLRERLFLSLNSEDDGPEQVKAVRPVQSVLAHRIQDVSDTVDTNLALIEDILERLDL